MLGEFQDFIDEFRWAARQQLENDLERDGFGNLLDLSVSQNGSGIWATAVVTLNGLDEPWRFRDLILRRTDFSRGATADDGKAEATYFSTEINELLATRPWPPPRSRPVSLDKPISELLGSVEAWPGGPLLRLLDPESLRARYLEYIQQIIPATWGPLKASIGRDPWVGPRPEVVEDAEGVWLLVSMRRDSYDSKTVWRYRELIVPPEGPAAAAVVVSSGYVERAVADFGAGGEQHSVL